PLRRPVGEGSLRDWWRRAFGACRERLLPATYEASVLEHRAGEFERKGVRIVVSAHVVPVEDEETELFAPARRVPGRWRLLRSPPGRGGRKRRTPLYPVWGRQATIPPPPPGSPSSCA